MSYIKADSGFRFALCGIAIVGAVGSQLFLKAHSEPITKEPTLHGVSPVAACPRLYKKHMLVGFGLYEGPPSEEGDLQPDNDSAWDLSHRYPAGYFIGCRYSGTNYVYPIEIPDSILSCSITSQTTFSCK